MDDRLNQLKALNFIVEKPEGLDLLLKLQPSHFTTIELETVFNAIRNFYSIKNVIPSYSKIQSMFIHKGKDTSKNIFFNMEADLSGLTSDFLYDILEKERMRRYICDRLVSVAESFASLEFEEGKTKLQQVYDSLFVENVEEAEAQDMLSLAQQDRKFEWRTTGIKALDKRGGLILGGYTVIAAPAKTGKSILAGQIALHQYLNHEGSIAYFSYEMGVSEVMARVLSNYSGIDLGEMLDPSTMSKETLKSAIEAEANLYFNPSKELTDYVVANYKKPRKEIFEELKNVATQRANKFFIFDEKLDWDALFLKMEMMVKLHNVKCIVIDYPFLIPRGKADVKLAGWEYILLQSRKIKSLSHKYGLNIITPAQYDAKDDKIKFMSNIINDADMAITLTRTADDKEYNTTTVVWKAMRNFKSIKNEPQLTNFKLENLHHYARFEDFEI